MFAGRRHARSTTIVSHAGNFAGKPLGRLDTLSHYVSLKEYRDDHLAANSVSHRFFATF